MHLGSTSSDELASYFHSGLGGVLANDQLKRPRKNKVYILNLQNADQGGSHWVMLYNSDYFDPYGAPPTKEVQKFVNEWTINQYQDLYSEACGYFCLYAADNVRKGLRPDHGLIPGEYKYNENFLKKYFYKKIADKDT